MKIQEIKKRIVLGILFFLPVIFLLFLYPSTHNYYALDVVKENVLEISKQNQESSAITQLEGNLTILAFLGKQPMDMSIAALNLKELIYENFKGFKGFQIVVITPDGTQSQITELEKELITYEELEYWHFVFKSENEINKIYKSLLSKHDLDNNLGTEEVFIIDKERNQRGRLDDRTEKEIEKSSQVYGLSSYNCIEIDDIKNKMSDDLRILFTEYRQKRKGNFDSTARRADDIKPKDEKN